MPTTRITTLTLAVLIAVLPALVACSPTRRPTFEPTQGVALTRTTDAVELRFTINASNNNPEPMPLDSVSYELRLDNQRVFSGQRSPEATIPPFGVQSFTLPAIIPASFLTDGQTQGEYRIVGTVSYRDPGRFNEILFDRNLRVPTAPLRVSGTIRFDHPVTPDAADPGPAD